MQTLHFRGSHGTLTACATSGHIIDAYACDCEDCARFGDYGSVALVDVHGCDPAVIERGGGDILSAALVWRDGGYSPACMPVADDDFIILEELPRLPPPDYRPVPVHDWHDADGVWIGLGTAREFEHWRAEGVLPPSAYMGRFGVFDRHADDVARAAKWEREATH